MASTLDLADGHPLEPDRNRALSSAGSELGDWLAGVLGARPGNLKLYERALTHASRDGEHYERLEFLGDRVLGMAVARQLYDRFPKENEGQLARRLNALVTGAVCADVGRRIGVGRWLRLGKQARDDGAGDSDNVLGDVVEALIGAALIDLGPAAAEAFVLRHWSNAIAAPVSAPRHPKSALQEWAAAHRRQPPVYGLIDRHGPHHAPRFRVKVAIAHAGEAEAEGASKQEAETAAAAMLLDQLEKTS